MSPRRDHEFRGDVLDRFAAGMASEEEGRLVFGHLLAGCAFCRRHLRLARWHSEGREMQHALGNVVPLGPPAKTYDEAFVAAQRAVAVVLERERIPVRTLLSELEAMSPEEREFKVRNLRRYAEGELAAALVEKSFDLRYTDPWAMDHYARLAVFAADAATPETAGGRCLLADCRARARAQLGNAHRIRHELVEAERELARAWQYLDTGSGEAESRAWVLLCTASLRTAQRAFAEASDLHDDAAHLYRRLHGRTGEATALIGGAWARIAAGDAVSALAPLHRSLDILRPSHPQEERLVRVASIHLALCYIDVGRPHDAYNAIALAEPYFEDCPDTIARLHWTWQLGKANRDKGDLFAAEVRLVRVRDELLQEERSEQVGEVSLDLAMVYARAGRRADFLRAVAEAAAIFHSLGARREYLAALGQLSALAQHEEAALGLLRQLVVECRGGVPRGEQ